MNQRRRAFIKRTGLAAAAGAFPTIIPARVLGAEAPSKKITLGFIGMGGQGTGRNLSAFLGLKDCVAVGVCDAFMGKANRARDKVHEFYGNKDCKAVQDFREIIADPSIDAVVISTPDHWHVPMSLLALAAGKDVFYKAGSTKGFSRGPTCSEFLRTAEQVEGRYRIGMEAFEQ